MAGFHKPKAGITIKSLLTPLLFIAALGLLSCNVPPGISPAVNPARAETGAISANTSAAYVNLDPQTITSTTPVITPAITTTQPAPPSQNSTTTTTTTTTTTIPGSNTTPTQTLPTSTTTTQPPPSEITVKSSDKSFTLVIPAGALPEGINPSSIHINRLANNDPYMPSINDKPALACYSIEPDGLTLTAPASINVSLSFSGNTTPMPLLFSDSRGPSLLDDVQVITAKNGGTLNIKGKISTFTSVIISSRGPFSFSMQNPENALAGLGFDVRASLTLNADYRNLVIKKKIAEGDNVVTYWIAFVSARYDCIMGEPGTGNHMTPDELKIKGSDIKLENLYRTQKIPLTGNFTAASAATAAALDCRVALELTTETRSDKYGFQQRRTSTYTPEISSTFAIGKPWANGNYLVQTSIISDPANYAHSIGLGLNLTCSVKVNGSQITFTGNAGWVTVKGEIQPNGEFTATGKGIVALSADIPVEFRGHFTGYMMFEGEYSMGGGGIRVIYKITGKSLNITTTARVNSNPLYFYAGLPLWIGAAGWIWSYSPRPALRHRKR